MATSRRAERRGAPQPRRLLGLVLGAALLAAPGWGQRAADIESTRHNLSASGPGPVHALTETRICVFCHTPHNSAPLTPLWNRTLEPRNYQTYTSETLKAGPLPQPTGATKLCLSCHDGTIATGAVMVPSSGIAMVGGGTLPGGSLANLGLDLSGHHPVSFRYGSSLPNAELVSPPPAELSFGGGDVLHCTTCHDPHKDTWGKFLVKDNRFSALCTSCHRITGWEGSAHATASLDVTSVLPRPPKDFPAYTTLAEWGCESCHTPHFAPTGPQLLAFTDAAAVPYTCTSTGCHGGQSTGLTHAMAAHPVARPTAATLQTGGADIAAQIRKPSAHVPLAGVFAPEQVGAAVGIPGVTCADCHNPHLVNARPANGPVVGGMLAGVAGIDRNGTPVKPATFEYELCFKCHAEHASQIEAVPRVVATTNTRLEFDPTNVAFHPVVGVAHNPDVPSLGTSLEPALQHGDQINCTSCHADDEGGSRGPHGSNYPPILRLRYTTDDGAAESYETYALCYQCHDRNSILSDESFRKAAVRTTPSGGGHSGHLAAGASCAACHDPHGIPNTLAGNSGSHEQLVNFDLRIVEPVPGAPYPMYDRTGTFAGNCTLVCHGVTHNATSYQ